MGQVLRRNGMPLTLGAVNTDGASMVEELSGDDFFIIQSQNIAPWVRHFRIPGRFSILINGVQVRKLAAHRGNVETPVPNFAFNVVFSVESVVPEIVGFRNGLADGVQLCSQILRLTYMERHPRLARATAMHVIHGTRTNIRARKRFIIDIIQ